MKYYIDQEDLNKIEFIEADSLEEAEEKVYSLIGILPEEE